MTQRGHGGCWVKIAFGELCIRVAQTQLLWLILVTFAQAQTPAQNNTSASVCRSVRREWWRHFFEEWKEDACESGRGHCLCMGDPVPTISMTIWLYRRMNINALANFCQTSSKNLLFQILVTYIHIL